MVALTCFSPLLLVFTEMGERNSIQTKIGSKEFLNGFENPFFPSHSGRRAVRHFPIEVLCCHSLEWPLSNFGRLCLDHFNFFLALFQELLTKTKCRCRIVSACRLLMLFSARNRAR